MPRKVKKVSSEKIPGIGELMRIAYIMKSDNALRLDNNWEAVKESMDVESGKKVFKKGKLSFGKTEEGRFFARCDSSDLKVRVTGKKRDVVNIVLLRSMLSVGYILRKRKEK